VTAVAGDNQVRHKCMWLCNNPERNKSEQLCCKTRHQLSITPHAVTSCRHHRRPITQKYYENEFISTRNESFASLRETTYRSFARTGSQLKMCDFSEETFKGFEVLRFSMTATTTQLLSSGEFCKLRYEAIRVKSASANVSFYTNNSKMPNF